MSGAPWKYWRPNELAERIRREPSEYQDDLLEALALFEVDPKHPPEQFQRRQLRGRAARLSAEPLFQVRLPHEYRLTYTLHDGMPPLMSLRRIDWRSLLRVVGEPIASDHGPVNPPAD